MNINEAAKEIGKMIAKEAVNMIDPEATVAALWKLWDKYEDREHEVCGDAATLIELLQGQLAESQRRERAAVEDLEQLAGQSSLCGICKYLSSKESDLICADCKGKPHLVVENFEWRGPQDEERIRND